MAPGSARTHDPQRVMSQCLSFSDRALTVSLVAARIPVRSSTVILFPPDTSVRSVRSIGVGEAGFGFGFGRGSWSGRSVAGGSLLCWFGGVGGRFAPGWFARCTRRARVPRGPRVVVPHIDGDRPLRHRSDDEPLDPASRPGGADEQVQAVAFRVPSGRRGTDEGGRERLVGWRPQRFVKAALVSCLINAFT